MPRVILVLILLTAACDTVAKRPPPDLDRTRAVLEATRSLATPKGTPRPGDWLESFPEPEQTFEQYLETNPSIARGERRTLYIQPIGTFTPARLQIVKRTSDFMGRFFGLPIVMLPTRSLDSVPADSRRSREYGEQILAGHILMKMLLPTLPKDAAAMIGLCSADLYPEESWNFVFGQANLRERVGVWSIARYGDPGIEKNFERCLLRTLKVAAHETGHMFSIPHCSLAMCVMNGSNSLEETDRGPLAPCPDCDAKICWASGADPVERLHLLAEFYAANGLMEESVHAMRTLRVLGSAGIAVPERSAVDLSAIEAVHQTQEKAILARDVSGYVGTMAPEFSMRMANGWELDRAGTEDLVTRGWKDMRSVDRLDLVVEDGAIEGDRAVLFVRREFESTDRSRHKIEGSMVQLEEWVRTSDGWRLLSLEEGKYDRLTKDGIPVSS